MKPSIHDNRVISYAVSSVDSEIILHTVSENGKERTDVRFRGVLAYRFEGDNFQTIIFDVVEADVTELVEENVEEFEAGRAHMWPGAWNVSTEAVLERLRKDDIHGYRLSSSFGMSGWILASGMELNSVGK